MSDRNDLTRWNHAGLTRFRYVDGKAAEYLEILRQQLVEQFADPDTGLCEWLKPAKKIPANEEKAETEILIQRQERLSRKQERILEMYYQDRRDWAWEITRTFARACHILTEHTNAYANEGYLGTATQWDNVRRLVEMLDYHPAPPASASTRLVLIAKENKSGIVAKGFQVKHSPAAGGDKIIFETLEDLLIDPALNELRPKGWDQSDEPAVPPVPPDNNGSTQPPAEERQFSSIANGPAINLQGVGEQWALQLNTRPDNNQDFKIKDFLVLDPEDSGIVLPEGYKGPVIGVNWLKELKAKATEICNFKLESGWSDISGWILPNIASESPDSLAEITGNPLDIVKAFQQRIELIGAYLDHGVYENTKLEDLVAPVAAVPGAVVTSWHTKPNSNVIPGQVAMIYRELRDEIEDKYVDGAKAATIAGIEKQTKIIHLKPSSVQNDWTTKWSKGEARLKVSPRWKRECWLNGDNVIRTVEPHGLSAESYISWKIDYGLSVVDELVNEGRSLVSVALVAEQLHIRIFNENGEMVVDKTENAENTENTLLGEGAINALKEQISKPNLSQVAKQNIIENAISCARYTQWRHAKVIEADKWDLQLEVTGPLPQEGVDLYELRPIEGSVLPADYEAIVLLGSVDDTPPNLEGVTPKIEEPPKPEDPEPIFTLKKVLPGELKDADGEVVQGGGLLPPASLPKIGCFLFPSPMLPLDLVKAAVELMLSIGVMAIPSTEEIVIKGMPFGGLLEGEESEADAAEKLFEMLDKLEGYAQEYDDENNPVGEPAFQKLVKWNDSLKADPSTVITEDEANAIKGKLEEMLTMPEGKEATILFQRLTEDIVGMGPLLAIPKEPIVKAVVQASDPLYMFNGSSKIGVGDWVVGKFSDGLRALKVSTINWFTDSDKTETFSLSFEKLDGNKELKKVYADFRGELIAEGATVNNSEVDPEEIELEDVPESLKVGRDVLLMSEEKAPVAAKIESIDGKTVTTKPPATGFTKGDLIIRGNVVLAGHGEGKPEKILGSGNAAKSNQEFTLEVEQVSFTPDATKSSGVAAAIEVEVAGRVWEQVSTLKDSVPGDHHYAIRMTEEGYVKILFGDGKHGRRLPSGKNNIQVRYRVGSGLAGNVPVGGFEKPVKPHPLVKEVHQPLRAAGGGDMEDMASLRENAPSTLLALERAVSLADFSHLAAAQSSVWQAKAFSQILHGGRTESVKVVIVPADGVRSTEINEAIRSFLQKQALPGVQVTVDHFVEKRFSLSITVRVKTDEFIAEEVEKAVASALVDHFTLKNRKLREPLYLSEVYKVVEGVKGVENSNCEIFEQPSEQDESKEKKALQVIKAANESTVVYLDTNADKNPSMLTVTHEEYQP